MTTEEQIQANRENALLGGVKTPEGKAISKYNALKHGLLSKEVFLEGEDEQVLIELTKRLRQELKPATEIEAILVDRIIANTWRLRRVLEVERNTMEWQKFYSEIKFEVDYGNKELKEKQELRKSSKRMIVNSGIDQILRYETTIERSIYKALHELQRLQSTRAGEKTPAPLAIDIDISKDE
ncbi:MAG: hypothetical protein Q8P26_03865 [Candidatus Levybacteria bacterium]|nr:hypothetical protein [Candidatus Levybacteria bacterium]